MQGLRNTVVLHFGGTLAADQSARIAIPYACRLEKVAVTASNAASSTLKLGTTADDDAWIKAFAVGQSGALVTKDYGDFDGDGMTAAMGGLPRLSADTALLATLDFDGAGGTAGANVTVTLTFLEG